MYKSKAWLYKPRSHKPFRLSRSKIDLFLECPRCFYLDRRVGISRPRLPGFSLNSAVDVLLKNEFDLLRKKGATHELIKRYKIKAVPYAHPDLDEWRNNFTGKSYLHKPTNLEIFGAVDDIWLNPKNELIIVDYKSTSTEKEISLDDYWKQGYKKQLEVYQWIFKMSGYKVAKTAYIVYANATKDRDSFDGKLVFKLTLHSHIGKIDWIGPVLNKIKTVLDEENIPPASIKCEYCNYRNEVKDYLNS